MRTGERLGSSSSSPGSADDRVVLDTNVFIAGGFNPGSRSAQLIRMVREGELQFPWNAAIRNEIEHVVGRIPRLSKSLLDGLFVKEQEIREALALEPFAFIEDPADRKFAALATHAGAPLISADVHLLRWRERLEIPVLRPAEFMRGM